MSRKALACTSEARLESRLASELTQAGLLTWHNDPQYMPGIPDRYVGGGNWIELKFETNFGSASRALNRQRTFLNMLEKHNEGVYVMVYLTASKLLFIEPWHQWKMREAHYPAPMAMYDKIGNSPCSCERPADINERISQCLEWWRARS